MRVKLNGKAHAILVDKPARIAAFQGLIILFLLLVVTGVAYADYLGPDRTIAVKTCKDECVQWKCWYVGKQNDSPGFSCRIFILSSSKSCPANPGSDQWSVNRCSWPSGHGGVDNVSSDGRTCNKTEKVCTWEYINLPEATINARFNCSNSGNSGWCLAGKVNISVDEPVDGEQITEVEADFGHVCDINAPSGNCKYSPEEGTGGADFWAHSTLGDTTRKSNASWSIDSTPPSLNVNKSGGGGDNGWDRSPVTYSCSGSDSLSGWGGCEVCVAGNCASGNNTASSEGTNAFSIRAWDVAGNEATSSATVKIDSIAPSINLNVASSAGGFYGNNIKITASATDNGSGVDSVEISIDGGPWKQPGSYDVSNGKHTIKARATDNAGNEASSSININVDGAAPIATITSPDVCVATSYIYTGVVTDGESGIKKAQIKMGSYVDETLTVANDGSWEYLLDASQIPPGTYAMVVTAIDKAGNSASSNTVSVQVDNVLPLIELDAMDEETVGNKLAVEDLESGVNKVEMKIVLSDGAGEQDAETQATFVAGDIPSEIVVSDYFTTEELLVSTSAEVYATVFDHCGNTQDANAEVDLPDTSTSTRIQPPVVGDAPGIKEEEDSPGVQSEEPGPLNEVANTQETTNPIPWEVVLVTSVSFVLATAALIDPRPRALNRLTDQRIDFMDLDAEVFLDSDT